MVNAWITECHYDKIPLLDQENCIQHPNEKKKNNNKSNHSQSELKVHIIIQLQPPKHSILHRNIFITLNQI